MKPRRLWSLPWDIPRWRMSRTRARLTAEARGIIRELWDECFAEGSIPDDPAECSKIAGVTVLEMERNWESLRVCFSLRRGKLYSKPVQQIARAVSKRYQKFGTAGSIGGLERARRMKDLRSNASSDACSQPIARASDSLSLSGFDFEVSVSPGKKNLEKTGGLDTAKISPAHSNGNGYDPAPGWEWFLATYPHTPKVDQACRAWMSVVDSQVIEDAIRQSLTQPGPWFLSQRWVDGIFDQAENWLFQRMWQGRPAPARSRGERRQFQDNVALHRAMQKRGVT